MSEFDLIREDVLDRLLTEGLITAEAVGRARVVSDRTGQPLEQVLNQLGLLSDEDLAAAYSALTGLPVWNLDLEPPSVDLSEIGVGQEFLRKVRALPVRLDGESLICAVCDPFDDEMRAGLGFATGRDVQFLVARLGDWRRAFDADGDDIQSDSFLDERRVERDMAFVEDHGVEGRAVELVTQAFATAVERNASDI